MNLSNSISMEKLVIQSTKENMARVEDLIYDICINNHVLNYYGVISVAVSQAVENAIVHGNNSDGDKKVVMSCGNCRGGMFFEIKDEGVGFDFNAFGDLPLEGERGDGIFMMKTLADKIEYSENGSRVRLEFLINGIEKADYLERCAKINKFFMPALINA